MGISIQSLPENIQKSKVLTADEIKQLTDVTDYPIINPAFDDFHLKQIIQYYSLNPDEMETELHRYAKKLLLEGKVDDAWQVLLAG